MKEFVFCTACGIKNPINSNFCFKCGNHLINIAENKTITKATPLPNTEFRDIKQSLKNLISSYGFIVISKGDCYVQFATDLDDSSILFEASLGNRKESSINVESEFRKLGFRKEPDSNYYKNISRYDFSVDEITDEIKIIFETIFEVTFSSYKIESEFETKSSAQPVQIIRSKQKVKRQENKKGCLSVFILLLFIGIYFANTDEEGSNKTNATEVVANSDFDGSVIQVENYLKYDYLKDPDSYQSIEWSAVQKVEKNSKYKYFVRHKYRAKNGFGGYNVEEQVFFLDPNGNVVDVQGF